MKKTVTILENFVDPVCLMKMDPGEKNLRVTYQMRTYYFCAESCRNAFEADPNKYLKSVSSKRKGWWGRYLERLNKITDGKPPKCH